MVLSDYLTGEKGCRDLVGREGRDSPHSPIRVRTGGSTRYRYSERCVNNNLHRLTRLYLHLCLVCGIL